MFTDALIAALRRAVPEGAAASGHTGIISPRHAERLAALVAEARAGGASVTEIGRAGQGAIRPTVVVGVSSDMTLLREEIFGPILPVLTYRTLDQAIAEVEARPRPLALYYYGPAGTARDKVLARTLSGNVTINGIMTHFAVESLPFGGVGASGMGAYHGFEGFRAMSHMRGIFDEPSRSLIPLGRPGGRFAKLFARYTMR